MVGASYTLTVITLEYEEQKSSVVSLFATIPSRNKVVLTPLVDLTRETLFEYSLTRITFLLA